MATYVLIAGGGHGGWCYQRVARLLRAEGHEVHCPTLTGLGEKFHLVSPDVGLDTHITDVVNLLFYEDLRDVVLVGHSYGGAVIAGVADQAGDRVGRLVYLDALHVENGRRIVDGSPMLHHLREGSRVVDGVELFGYPDEAMVEAWGITDPDDAAWALPRLTPHPWRCVDEPLTLADPEAVERIPSYEIVATRFGALHRDPEAMARAQAEGRVWEIDAGHDLMIAAPEALASALVEIAAATPTPAVR